MEKEFISSNLKFIEYVNYNLDVYVATFREAELGFIRDINLIKSIKQNTSDVYDYSNTESSYIENKLIKLMNDFHDINSTYFYVKSLDRLYYIERGKLNVYTIEKPYIERESWYTNAIKSKKSVYMEDSHNISFNIDSRDKEMDIKLKLLKDNPKKVMSFSFAISDAFQDNIIGVISINVDIKNLNRICNKSKVNQFEEITIVNSSGEIIYLKDYGRITDKFLPDVFSHIYNSKFSGSFKIYINKEKYLVLYSFSEITKWVVVKFIPLRIINKTVINSSRFNFVLGLLFTTITIIGSLMISYSISNPIVKLAKYMKDITNENFRASETMARNDEIGVLYKSFNDMINKINYLIVEEYKSKLSEKHAQIKVLQSQINPHFLYNTLQSISGLAMEKGIPEVNDSIMALGSMFRYAIKPIDDVVTINEEIGHIENYFKIQKIRFEENIKLSIDISKDLYETPIPKLTLQPIIENCFMHGLEKKINGGEIKIRGFKNKEKVFIEVVDNGLGIDKSELDTLLTIIKDGAHLFTNTKGLGLHNVNARLVYAFGDDYGIDIKSTYGEGTCVCLILRAKEAEN